MSLDQLLNMFNAIVDGNTSDEVIAFIEALSDTYASVNDETIAELQAIVEQKDEDIRALEENWRKRYVERFMGKPEVEITMTPEETVEVEVKTDFNELFEEV